ncbi:SCP-like protein [Ancylostoma caninum]|uniref:SCP-like protein n=1 Tax=Ancylostoma caninum TaxID=29170 RepID=A0A368G5Y9_ANCCA|nr:SCP-like protein [Ancylostoma caninum]
MTLLPTLLLTLLPIAFATCPGKDSLSDSRVKQVLDLQNAWREQAAAGTLFTGKRQLPAGRNIYKLEWDCDLEELAKDAVKGCPETRTEIPRKGQAFLHLNSTVGKKRNQALNYSMTAWFDEAVFEVKGKDVVRSGNDKSLDFSNMINSDSYKVGCAEKRCGKGRNSTAAAACFYNKA